MQQLRYLRTALLFSAFACGASAQQATTPAAPAPLPNPSVSGTLTAAPPTVFNAGPFGKLDLNGILSGMGQVEENAVPGDKTAQATLSNAQLFLQKTDGWWQFYLQGGAYDIPALGTPFLSSSDTVNDFFGPLPAAYLKLVPDEHFSFQIGQLPTLIGAECTFTFQNISIERGLLWNQENAINRGVQVNATAGKITAALSWNDGFYSNRYTWLTGYLGYAFDAANTLAFTAGGNYGKTAFRTLATPVQNNGRIYDVIFTHSKGNWFVQPYFQYTNVPTNLEAGIPQGSSTWGGAVLAAYKFKHGFSLAGRWEYITATGSISERAVTLTNGPGSSAWSVTVTPTYQNHAFFARAEFSYVHLTSFIPGAAFGSQGLDASQPRGVAELGFLF
jgi:hypothetical protein